MLISESIQHIKNGTLQNTAHDFWDNFDRVYNINVCLVDIFSQLNAMGNRYFSNVTEILTAPLVDWVVIPTTTRTFSNDISRFWEIKWDWVTLDQVNVSLSMTHPEEVEETPWYVMTWSKNIVTAQPYTTLTAIYARFPKEHSYNNVAEALDLPPQLLWTLEFLVYWRLCPIFFEQWASLANNYLAQADKQLSNYAANMGLSSKQTRFTA